MFSLEISFQDGVSQPMMILVRHPRVIVGADEKNAHVVIEDMKELNYQLCFTKKLGNTFTCQAIPLIKGDVIPDLNHLANGSISLDLGNLSILATSLDCDLMVHTGEAPDRAGVRVLRQASSIPSSKFPAVVVADKDPIIVSFPVDHPIYIGRSNKCAVRLPAEEISGKHARMGYENGQFWIEDLGSTNGTFVNGQQISGRINIDSCVPITLGNRQIITGVSSQAELDNLKEKKNDKNIQAQQTRKFPILISMSEVARPTRLVLPEDIVVSIGRDPSNDMWLGAPHVSRHHCEVKMLSTGLITIEDFSTNGTSYGDGILKKGSLLEIQNEPKILNFGGNLTVAVCFNEEQEQQFIATGGNQKTFEKEVKHSKNIRTENQSIQQKNVIENEQQITITENEKRKNGFSVSTACFEEYFSSLPIYIQILCIVLAVLCNAFILLCIKILLGSLS